MNPNQPLSADQSPIARAITQPAGEPERFILGETEMAGLPISAPVGSSPPIFGNLRWIKREHSYSMQQCIITELGLSWVDIPLVLE